MLVNGTRLPIDTILEDFNDGTEPEAIVSRYSVLKLADVYAVIAYYLQNREAVDEYLEQRRDNAERIREQYAPLFSINDPDTRQRILARRNQKKRE